MIGVVYAVLLAFVVTLVWGQREEARVRVEQEANAVADLSRGAQAFLTPIQAQVRGGLRAYLETVLQTE